MCSVSEYIMNAGAWEVGGWRHCIPLEMGLQVVVSLIWVLGTELGSSERAIHGINH